MVQKTQDAFVDLTPCWGGDRNLGIGNRIYGLQAKVVVKGDEFRQRLQVYRTARVGGDFKRECAQVNALAFARIHASIEHSAADATQVGIDSLKTIQAIEHIVATLRVDFYIDDASGFLPIVRRSQSEFVAHQARYVGRDELRLWDAHHAEEIIELRGHRSFAWSVMFSPDGRKLVSRSGDGTIRVWDASLKSNQ